jgi:hypothetical protein
VSVWLVWMTKAFDQGRVLVFTEQGEPQDRPAWLYLRAVCSAIESMSRQDSVCVEQVLQSRAHASQSLTKRGRVPNKCSHTNKDPPRQKKQKWGKLQIGAHTRVQHRKPVRVDEGT